MEGWFHWRPYLTASLVLHLAVVVALTVIPEFRPPTPKVYRVRLVSLAPPASSLKSPKSSPKKEPRKALKNKSLPSRPKAKSLKLPPRPSPKKASPKKVASQRGPLPLKKRSSSPASAEARIPKKLSPRSPRTSEAFKATEEALLARRLSQIRERVREKEEAARLSAAISRVAQKVAGDAQGRSSGAFNRYLARITTLIEANLVIPEVIKDPSRLSATVVVVIDAQGHLRRLSFEKTSGHRLFDEAVRRAVYLAAPFPPPPSELSPPLEIGVVVRPLRLIKEES